MSSEIIKIIKQNLANWESSLFKSIPVAGLISRNPTAYKWKSVYRSWVLREALLWRQHDLMSQSFWLYQSGHILGARIILRSGFETLAILIYLNEITQGVLEGSMTFDDWSEKTTTLLLGTRNNPDMPVALNIITILQKCDKRYRGLMKMYASLSESAHPNYEGLIRGYSATNYDEFETAFSNRWMELYGERHLNILHICMETFHDEYDALWPQKMEKLESWIESNDAKLEVAMKSENENHKSKART